MSSRAENSGSSAFLPPLDLNQPSTPPKTSGNGPRGSSGLGPTGSTNGDVPDPKTPSPAPPTRHTHRFLSPDEWARVAHGVGAIKSGEEHRVVHPSSWYYPPRGLPDGLYRTVMTHKTKYRYLYHFLSHLRWTLMILQIVLAAILTALGSVSMANGTPITVLAANQTVIAGILALLHNSGLPDRYRCNQGEFTKVESHLREMLDTGIVPSGRSIDELIAECWDKLQIAQATVVANTPSNYIPSGNLNTPSKEAPHTPARTSGVRH